MVNLIIDNKPVSVEDGATILEAARKINIRIPTLCYLDLGELKMVNKVASCRMCVVEVEGRRNLAPSCATPVAEGMKVTTNSQAGAVRAAPAAGADPVQPSVRLPDLCQVHRLRTAGAGLGVRHQHQALSRREVSIPHRQDAAGALKRDPEKCIMCRRCETMCNEVQTVGALTAFGRGFNVVVGPAEMKPMVESNCVYCGQCVSVCPTAALTGARLHPGDLERRCSIRRKTVVVQVAPAIRAAIGEEFGHAPRMQR